MAFDLDEDELRATRKMNKADRNEIEVGEYVRTEKGLIAKYLGFEKDDDDNDMKYNKYLFDNKIYWYYEYYNEYVYDEDWERFKGNIVKHSKQLIDLIEVGDIVNGREVKHIAMFEGFPDYPKLIFVDETHLIPDDTCENDEIKTILTKEQFDVNCYKVGR